MRAAILRSLAALLLAGCSLGGESGRHILANGRPAAADGDYGEGKRLLLSGNFGLAVQQLRAALRVQPGSPEILNALAIAYDHLGRHDIAQGYFAEALAADPDSVQTLNNIGRSLVQSGSFALASVYLERSAMLDPANPVVTANLQSIASRSGLQPASYRRPARPGRSGWIERTSPVVQTIVTRGTSRGDGLGDADESMLPLLSFASLDFGGGGGSRVRVVTGPRSAEQPAVEPPAISVPAMVAIANGNGRNGMAARLDLYFQSRGWRPARLLNADHFDYATTEIAYRPGFADMARSLAATLPIAAGVKEISTLHSDVVLRIGKDLVSYDGRIDL